MDVSRKGIVSYVSIAFGFAWAVWEIPVLFGVSAASPGYQVYQILGSFAPAIAALVVRKWITREGFADAGIKIDRRKWRFYVVAWLLPIGVLCAVALEAVVFSIGTPDLSIIPALTAMGQTVPQSMVPYVGYLIVPQLMVKAVVFTPVLWGEEFGWRGYLQARIFAGKPLLAAVVTGIIWAIWHYPLIFRGFNYQDSPWLGALMFPVTCIFLSIIFGWLREKSGSIWAPSLAHSATNVIGGTLSLLWFYGVASQIWVGYQGVLAWLPLGALSIWIAIKNWSKPLSAEK